MSHARSNFAVTVRWGYAREALVAVCNGDSAAVIGENILVAIDAEEAWRATRCTIELHVVVEDHWGGKRTFYVWDVPQTFADRPKTYRLVRMYTDPWREELLAECQTLEAAKAAKRLLAGGTK